MTIEATFKIRVKNLEIEEDYYSFDYMIWKDGVLATEGCYESDHDWQDDLKGLRELLVEEGEAIKLAAEDGLKEI